MYIIGFRATYSINSNRTWFSPPIGGSEKEAAEFATTVVSALMQPDEAGDSAVTDAWLLPLELSANGVFKWFEYFDEGQVLAHPSGAVKVLSSTFDKNSYTIEWERIDD